MANMKNTSNTFSRNQTMPGTHVNGAKGNGDNHPPRNRMVVSEHMRTIETYSPSMNMRYGVDEYSTMKPATSSDSASGRSNGGRFVSASAETKNTMNIGNSGSQNQFRKPQLPSCARTMSLRLSEPTHSSTVMMTKPIDTSYDTICAADRREPRNGYFELDAQPPMMTP